MKIALSALMAIHWQRWSRWSSPSGHTCDISDAAETTICFLLTTTYSLRHKGRCHRGRRHPRMGLRAKFNLVVLVACFAGFLVAAVVLYRVADANARDQILQNARIMMSAADAIRHYTSTDLAPLLPMETRAGKFVPETVPAFAAQSNLKQLQSDFPGFAYREAALNPTNPANRAYDWEADIIRSFRDRPDLHEVITERDTPSGRLLEMARPITVS